MGPGKVILRFMIDSQHCNIDPCASFSWYSFVEFICGIVNYLGTEKTTLLFPMPQSKLDGVFSHFEKIYENKMTVCDCRIFLGNSARDHLVGEQLICNFANIPRVCNLENLVARSSESSIC